MYNHQLDTFIQASDAGSFSKAAETLFISSTSVMKRINLLEGSLEVQLFNRTPRGLTLRSCAALERMRVPICCAVSIYHPLAQKKKLTVKDLYGRRGHVHGRYRNLSAVPR